MNNNDQLHVMCTLQVHNLVQTSEKELDKISESLSASANYLRKLVEGEKTKATGQETVNPDSGKKGEVTSITVHGDTSYEAALKGFTKYDSKDINTPSYLVKREAYDQVRSRYPSLDNLIRDEKVSALKELNSVGFRYFSITVSVHLVRDGKTEFVKSKAHHRLEKPSTAYLKSILEDVFGAVLRPEKAIEPDKTPLETLDDTSPNV